MSDLSVGIIISFDWEKGYGWIKNGKDSFFFHKNFLPKGTTKKDVNIGDSYEYDPTPGKKGMEARNLRRINTYKAYKLSDRFITTKNNSPKSGEVIFRIPVVSEMYDTPDQAKNALKAIATAAGCNALLNLQYFKDTFSEPSGRRGTHYFSVHGFTVDFALVKESYSVRTELEAKRINSELDNIARQYESETIRQQQLIASRRERQYASACFIATAVYEDNDCWEVNKLRNFRDETLKNYWLGRGFIKIYYRYSPKIAVCITHFPKFKRAMKKLLDILVKNIVVSE